MEGSANAEARDKLCSVTKLNELACVADTCGGGVHSFVTLRNLEWCFRTDVSGRPSGPFFKGQAVLLRLHHTPKLGQISSTSVREAGITQAACSTHGSDSALFIQLKVKQQL
jgi:hypothetical protein